MDMPSCDEGHPGSDEYGFDVEIVPIPYGMAIDHRIQVHQPPQTVAI